MTRLWLVGVCALGACASAPTLQRADPADPFVACVAPTPVTIARDDDGVVVLHVEANSPSAVVRFQEAADACGAWRLDADVAPHITSIVALSRCGESCPDGWEAELARNMGRAPESSASDARCGRGDDVDWAGFAVARLLDAPGLAPAGWVERAVLLGRAGIGTAETWIDARLAELQARADREGGATLARAALAALPRAAESLQFHAAMALVQAGDIAGRNWLNQLATSGRTAFRAFAQAELARIE